MRKDQIRDAATIILVRDTAQSPAVLMGKRGAKAAFMPSKFVFPGGAVDQDDDMRLSHPVAPRCRHLLAQWSNRSADTLAACAIRELWEETGQILGRPGSWQAPSPAWSPFAANGHCPDASALRFVFRAITPKGLPRRFDARFFLADADALASDPDDFSAAEDELSDLQWVPLEVVRSFDLPLVTCAVLDRIDPQLRGAAAPETVPFFTNKDEARGECSLTLT